MTKHSNISIVVSFLGLWIDSFFSDRIQIFIGFLLIFSFGILHGANDLLLIENITSKKQAIPFTKIVSYYVLVVLLGAFLFYAIPWLALVLFIGISAFHFGEQEWQHIDKGIPKKLAVTFYFFYGATILFLLFSFHIIEVQKIIFEITTLTVPPSLIVLLLKIVIGVLFLLGSYVYWKLKTARRQLLTEILYLLLFMIIFKSSNLIWGFAIYFVLWHSIPSIIDQIRFIHGKYDLQLFISYCKSAILYWGLSIIGISILFFSIEQEQVFNALFFSFLASITFPHALVITQMFSREKGK